MVSGEWCLGFMIEDESWLCTRFESEARDSSSPDSIQRSRFVTVSGVAKKEGKVVVFDIELLEQSSVLAEDWSDEEANRNQLSPRAEPQQRSAVHRAFPVQIKSQIRGRSRFKPVLVG